LQESQELFELYVSDYLPLQRSTEELLHLKALWDTVGAVMFTFEDWYRWAAGRSPCRAGLGWLGWLDDLMGFALNSCRRCTMQLHRT
jgi:hypothetical protein